MSRKTNKKQTTRQEKIVIICPTKGRPDRLLQLFNSIKETAKNKESYEFYAVIDKGDNSYNNLSVEGINRIQIENKLAGLVYPTNAAFAHLSGKYFGYMFVGDDCLFRTNGWDEILLNKLKETDYNSILYTNDLLRRECLPINFIISYKIAEQLGFMAYPKLKHMFVDTYWKEAGEYMDCLYYFPNVVIEHMHYVNGKAGKDATYSSCSGDWNRDEAVYFEWRREGIDSTLGSLLQKI